MKDKVSKSLHILIPFIEKGLEIARIDQSRIRRVVGYIVPLDRDEKQSAQVIHHGNGYYTISLRISEPIYKTLGNRTFKKQRNTRSNLACLLDSIAHEISHLQHWEHQSDHFRLQAKIMVGFATLIKKLEITDTSVRYDKAIKTVDNTKKV